MRQPVWPALASRPPESSPEVAQQLAPPQKLRPEHPSDGAVGPVRPPGPGSAQPQGLESPSRPGHLQRPGPPNQGDQLSTAPTRPSDDAADPPSPVLEQLVQQLAGQPRAGRPQAGQQPQVSPPVGCQRPGPAPSQPGWQQPWQPRVRHGPPTTVASQPSDDVAHSDPESDPTAQPGQGQGSRQPVLQVPMRVQMVQVQRCQPGSWPQWALDWRQVRPYW